MTTGFDATVPATYVPLIVGAGGPIVGCYPGMKDGPSNAAVSHVYVNGRDTCACGAIQLPPGTLGLPLIFPATLPTA